MAMAFTNIPLCYSVTYGYISIGSGGTDIRKKISGISLHILSTQFLYYVVACNSFYIS